MTVMFLLADRGRCRADEIEDHYLSGLSGLIELTEQSRA
jgi:hypothetical protein